MSERLKRLLIIILVSIVVWAAIFFGLKMLFGRLALSLLISIVGAILPVLLYWALSQNFLAERKQFGLYLVLAVAGSAVGLITLSVATKTTEQISVDCRTGFVNRPWIEANYMDDVEWHAIPHTSRITISFFGVNGSPFSSPTLGGGSVVRDTIRANHTNHRSYYYRVECIGTPIKIDPMIQIPRRAM